jgi:hypothetical protein
MRKLVLLAVLALSIAPAAALADDSPGQGEGQSPAQQCKSQRTAIGVDAFGKLYGSGANAFGKCVSHQSQVDSQADSSAAAACKSEEQAGESAFAAKYGTGKGHNAFGKCVSQKSQEAESESQQATVNAARTCRNELKTDASSFSSKYGKAKNAFGKCVSAQSKKG